MNASAHPLLITTLATWLSVVMVAGVGWWFKPQFRDVQIELAETSGVMQADVFLGHMEDLSEGASGTPVVAEPVVLEPSEQTYALPPAMPEPLVMKPLPEIPEPQAIPEPQTLPPPAPDAVAGTAGATSTTPVNPTPTPATATRQPSTGASRVGSASSAARNTGSGSTSSASRMAAGKMPAPRYPMDARRRGEEGTVVVEFTVDASGRVIAAEARQATPWASLNREALRAVRSWKFPPGDVMKMQRPIVFKLR